MGYPAKAAAWERHPPTVHSVTHPPSTLSTLWTRLVRRPRVPFFGNMTDPRPVGPGVCGIW
jgi:hypothetical protein